MDATAAAQEPEPEESVIPTPRSQKRTRISFFETTLTNSTFVPFGKCELSSISAPRLAQSM